MGSYIFYLDDQNISSALDRLAQPAAPLPSLSSIIPQSRSRSRSRSQSAYQDQLISEEVLIKILQYIFPDSAPTPVEQVINYFLKFIGISVSVCKGYGCYQNVTKYFSQNSCLLQWQRMFLNACGN